MRLRLFAAILAGLLLLAGFPTTGAASSASLRDGAAQFAQGRFAEAEAIFTRAVALRPLDAHGWLWLGVVQFHRGAYVQAERTLARAAGLAPRDAAVLLWWGHALARSDHAGEAETVFRQALLLPGDSRVHELATQALRAMGPVPPGRLPRPVSAETLRKPTAPSWVISVGSYSAIARFYNPLLTSDEADRIGRALLGYSYQFNLDPRLVVALVVIESGFQPMARSRVGALGLGQLMPETARALGVDPTDPTQNLYGSILYLKGNLDRFGWENVHLALAAYNAGRSAVERYEGIPPYAETQWYVVNVTSLYRRLLSISGEMPEVRRRLLED
jgi:soluble lytic murein transglycosylase-like protein